MKKLTSALGKLALLSGLLSNTYAAEMVLPLRGVYDGDTVYSELRMLPNPLNNISVRISNIDTPEIRTKCLSEKELGLKAKEEVQKLLFNYQNITVRNFKWDKYGGRINGEIILKDGTSLGQLLIDKGLAVPYDGGTKQSWCK